jgi:hypothetical protein
MGIQRKHSPAVLEETPDIVIGYMADNNTSFLATKYRHEESYTELDCYRDIQINANGDRLSMDRLANQYAFCSESLNDTLNIKGSYLYEEGE